MRAVLLFLAGVLFAGLSAQSVAECAAVQDAASVERMAQLRDEAQSFAQAFQSRTESESSIINIPVQLHIIRRSDGTGSMSVEEWADVLDNVNDYYSAADLYFFDCNPPNFVDSDEYFDFDANPDQANIMAVHQVDDVMNVYVPGGELISFGGNSICGYAYFPFSFTDVIVTKYDCMINGTTFVHEVGHYFGLYHTHGTSNCGQLTDELVDGSNCATAGDEVCDTPADPNLRGVDCDEFLVNEACNYVGNAVDVNGAIYAPDVSNIMSYSRKECRTYLSPEQFGRANFYATTARDYLSCANGCVAPEATFSYAIVDGNVVFTNLTAGNVTDYNWDLNIAPSYNGETPEPIAYPPGSYEVCLQAVNNCGASELCQTIEVPDNDEGLVFTLGQVACAQAGELREIPIVFENFGDVLNFQFSIAVEKPTVARLVDISFGEDFQTGSAQAVLNDSTGTLIWDSNLPSSFLDGTVVAVISLEVLAGANDSTAVMITGDPTAIYAESGAGASIEVSSNSGGLSRCSFASIVGTVHREDDTALTGVNIFLFSEGEMLEITTTDESGAYSFNQLPTEANYSIVPLKDDDYLYGVNAGDLSRIQQDLLSVMPLVGPYPIIAGDVSNPGNLNSGDLSRIRQLILGDIAAFSDVDSWRFVAADYQFEDDDDPTAENFPETIVVDGLTENIDNADFIAVKMGDVNNASLIENSNEITFLLSAEAPPAVELPFAVDVRAVDFNNMLAGQFSIGWDPAVLNFVSVGSFEAALELSPTNFSFTQTVNGRLPWVWFETEPTTLPDSTVMFSINFTIAAEVGDSINICFTEQPTSFYFENDEQELMATFNKYQTTAVLGSNSQEWSNNEQLVIYPNPVTKNGRFHLLTSESIVSIQLFDLHGRRLQQWARSTATSYELEALPSGVYHLVVQGENDVWVKKIMIE